jgi:hypothetical protein
MAPDAVVTAAPKSTTEVAGVNARAADDLAAPSFVPSTEPQLLDFVTHQHKVQFSLPDFFHACTNGCLIVQLMPLVATAFAFAFTGNRMREMYDEVRILALRNELL